MTATTPKTEPQPVTRIRKIVTGGAQVLIVVIAIQLFFALNAANANIINFDNLQPFSNGTQVPDGYGTTPAVTVSYSTHYFDSISASWVPFYSYVSVWNGGFADLHTAAYPAGPYSYALLEITLTANDPSQMVLLNSFEVGAYPGPANFTLPAGILEVVDGSVPNHYVGGAVPPVLAVYPGYSVSGLAAQTLSPGVEANSLSILLETPSNNIGINDINFSITGTGTAVPEPATMLLLGSGLLGLVGLRRKLRK